MSTDPNSTEEELRWLAARQEAACEEERSRIVREIHDILGQNLTVLKLEVAWMRHRLLPDQELLRRKLESMSTLIDETTQAVRRISRQLRPPLLDDLGLIEAVTLHLEEFRQRTGIDCEVVVPPGDFPVGRDHSTAIFRILQQLLDNVERHSGATSVRVSLESDDRSTTLRVSDNGSGFPLEKGFAGKSYGLISVRERAAALGGSATFSGEPQGGTTVVVRIPLVRKGE